MQRAGLKQSGSLLMDTAGGFRQDKCKVVSRKRFDEADDVLVGFKATIVQLHFLCKAQYRVEMLVGHLTVVKVLNAVAHDPHGGCESL